MLRIWSVSGQELAAVPTGDTFKDVIDLKRHLRSRHGFPVCLQQLLEAGRCLGEYDPLVGPVDLQLVLLSALNAEQMPQAESEFIESAEDGLVEVGRALWAAGVDKNVQFESTRQTALMLASRNGHMEIARLLLDAGAEPNLWDCDGETALMCASSRGHVEIVRLLLDAGADKNFPDEYERTALMHASRNGHIEIVRWLLDAGADMNLRDFFGRTARTHASRRVEIASLLEAELAKPKQEKDSSAAGLK